MFDKYQAPVDLPNYVTVRVYVHKASHERAPELAFAIISHRT